MDNITKFVDQILLKKQIDQDGIYWLGGNSDYLGSDIYSGCTGIIIFLYEAYQQSPATELKLCIEQACRHALTHIMHGKFVNGFYCGTLGSIAMIGNIAKQLGLTDILLLCSSAFEVHINKHELSSNHDITDGNAGTLLALLHCYSLFSFKTELIKKLIFNIVDCLIKGIEFSENGIFWNLTPFQIKGINGFAHGIAGISFVFCELARAFDFDLFDLIGLEATRTLRKTYSTTLNNWPDHRHGIFTHDQAFEFKKQVYLNNKKHFEITGDTVAWCHGAPGVAISLINLAAYNQISRDKQMLMRISEKITKTISESNQFSVDRYTLCHGLGGLNLILKDIFKKGLCLVHKFQAIEPDTSTDQDWDKITETAWLGLMNGLAGIGYFLIINKSGRGNHILYPKLSDYSCFSKTYFTEPDREALLIGLIGKHFSKSAVLISKGDFAGSPIRLSRINYSSLNKMLCNNSSLSAKPGFRERNKFDLQINKINLKRFSNCYVATTELLRREYFEDVKKLDQGALSDLNVSVSEYCELINVKRLSKSLGFDQETETVLNILTTTGCIQLELNNLSTQIIKYFKNGASSIGSFIASFYAAGGNSKHLLSLITKTITDQVLVFIRIGVMIPAIQISRYE